MNLCEAIVLPFVRRVNHPGVSLSLLPYLRRLLGKNVQDLYRLIANPAWEARWVASQKIGDLLPRDEALVQLCQLAEDSQRNVREGAAYGLGFLLAHYPSLKQIYKDKLRSMNVSEKLRKALLHSAVVLWRGFPQHLETAIDILTAAAEQPPRGCFQTIGSHLAAVELMKSHPQRAQQLKKEWATSANVHLNYHALRANGEKAAILEPHSDPLYWSNTSEISVPKDTLSQIIGQEKAVEIVRVAAKQRRFVFLMGDPGTGKSMLAQSIAEQLSGGEFEDVIALPNPKYPMNPFIQTVAANKGMERIEQMRQAHRQAQQSVHFLWWSLFLGICVTGITLSYIYKGWLFSFLTVLILLFLFWFRKRILPIGQGMLPKLLVSHSIPSTVPFIDATGLQGGALFGDVRHDPFQSGGRETPPHQLLEPGAIHLAHKGILFIDEVGTLSLESQQQLLTVIQEKKFPIVGRLINSSGSMIRSHPIPCDFTLVLAGNEDDLKEMHPALRSRIRGFGYEIVTANMILDTPQNQQKFVQFIAQEVLKDRKIPHFTKEAAESIIDQARKMAQREGYLSLHLRELGGLVRAAGDMAVLEGKSFVKPNDVEKALKVKKSIEEQIEEISSPLNAVFFKEKTGLPC